MLGGNSKSSSNADIGDKNYQQAANEGINLAGVELRRNSSLHATDNSANEGFIFGNISSGKGGSTSVTVTDHGAISGAMDFGRDIAKEAFGFGETAFLFADTAADRAGQQTTAAMKQTDKALGQVSELAQAVKGGASQKTILYLMGGTMLVATVAVLAVTFGGD